MASTAATELHAAGQGSSSGPGAAEAAAASQSKLARRPPAPCPRPNDAVVLIRGRSYVLPTTTLARRAEIERNARSILWRMPELWSSAISSEEAVWCARRLLGMRVREPPTRKENMRVRRMHEDGVGARRQEGAAALAGPGRARSIFLAVRAALLYPVDIVPRVLETEGGGIPTELPSVAYPFAAHYRTLVSATADAILHEAYAAHGADTVRDAAGRLDRQRWAGARGVHQDGSGHFWAPCMLPRAGAGVERAYIGPFRGAGAAVLAADVATAAAANASLLLLPAECVAEESVPGESSAELLWERLQDRVAPLRKFNVLLGGAAPGLTRAVILNALFETQRCLVHKCSSDGGASLMPECEPSAHYTSLYRRRQGPAPRKTVAPSPQTDGASADGASADGASAGGAAADGAGAAAANTPERRAARKAGRGKGRPASAEQRLAAKEERRKGDADAMDTFYEGEAHRKPHQERVCAMCGQGHAGGLAVLSQLESDLTAKQRREPWRVWLSPQPLHRKGCSGAYVHRLCAMYAPLARCDDQGNWWNVAKEVARGRRLKCTTCGKRGATIKCGDCAVNLHLHCALLTKWSPSTVCARAFYCDKHADLRLGEQVRRDLEAAPLRDLSRGKEPHLDIPVLGDAAWEAVRRLRAGGWRYVARPLDSDSATNSCAPHALQCCDCTHGCDDPRRCACLRRMGAAAYDTNGNLRLDRPVPCVYECNMMCKCHKLKCRNRVASCGITYALAVVAARPDGAAASAGARGSRRGPSPGPSAGGGELRPVEADRGESSPSPGPRRGRSPRRRPSSSSSSSTSSSSSSSPSRSRGSGSGPSPSPSRGPGAAERAGPPLEGAARRGRRFRDPDTGRELEVPPGMPSFETFAVQGGESREAYARWLKEAIFGGEKRRREGREGREEAPRSAKRSRAEGEKREERLLLKAVEHVEAMLAAHKTTIGNFWTSVRDAFRRAGGSKRHGGAELKAMHARIKERRKGGAPRAGAEGSPGPGPRGSARAADRGPEEPEGALLAEPADSPNSSRSPGSRASAGAEGRRPGPGRPGPGASGAGGAAAAALGVVALGAIPAGKFVCEFVGQLRDAEALRAELRAGRAGGACAAEAAFPEDWPMRAHRVVGAPALRTPEKGSSGQTPKKAAAQSPEAASPAPEGGSEFVVERVVDSRVCDGVRQFLVKWEGYGHLWNTWEPLDHFSDACREGVLKPFLDGGGARAPPPRVEVEEVRDGAPARFAVDARRWSNVGRFVRRATDRERERGAVNLVRQRVFRGEQDPEKPGLAFFSYRDIAAMEELLY